MNQAVNSTVTPILNLSKNGIVTRIMNRAVNSIVTPIMNLSKKGIETRIMNRAVNGTVIHITNRAVSFVNRTVKPWHTLRVNRE